MWKQDDCSIKKINYAHLKGTLTGVFYFAIKSCNFTIKSVDNTILK